MQSSDEQPMKSPYQNYVWNLDEVQNAIDGISSGFDWTASPQGFAYWREVCGNLLAIRQYGRMMEAENAPPCLPL
jgi:hypothetical protein